MMKFNDFVEINMPYQMFAVFLTIYPDVFGGKKYQVKLSFGIGFYVCFILHFVTNKLMAMLNLLTFELLFLRLFAKY